MDLASAKMIGAGLASIALIGAGVGIGSAAKARAASARRSRSHSGSPRCCEVATTAVSSYCATISPPSLPSGAR